MASRIVVLLAAIALLVFGVTRLHGDDACTKARLDAFAVGARTRPVSDGRLIADRLLAKCSSGARLMDGTAALLRGGADQAAGRIAAVVVAREPRRRDGWLAVAAVDRRRGDNAAADAALARARRLDPIGLRTP
jgi:hypothetical protein